MTATILTRPAAAARILFALAAFLLLLLALPAAAQTVPVPAAPAEPAAPAATAEDLEALVGTLTDDAERQKLVQQLQTLIEARRATAAPTEDRPFGAEILDTLSAQVARLGNQVTTAATYAIDLPEAWNWIQRQATDPDSRGIWLDILVKVVVALAVGILAEALVRRLLRRPRRAVETRPDGHVLARLAFLLARTFLDILPILAFAGAAYAMLPLLDPRGVTRIATLAIVNANLLVRLIAAAGRVALSPEAPSLRFVRLSDAAADYLFHAVRRIAAVSVYGYFFVRVLYLLGASYAAYAVLLKLLGLIVAAMLIGMVLRNRAAVADWLRGNGAKTGALSSLREHLAEIWHVLAIVYIVAVCAIWLLQVDEGFGYLFRATLLTLAILVVARIAVSVVRQLLRRGFAVSPDLQRALPSLQEHANRYLPLLQYTAVALIWIIAALGVLEAWGIGVFGWAGGVVLGTALKIALIIAVAIVAWELFSAAITRSLRRAAAAGGAAQPSARVRTLVPLLERIALIVLTVIVGLVILAEIGIDIGPLLAGAGIIGLAVGFGAQSLVKDVITGLFILLEDQFAVGDVVNVGGKGGLVEGISLRTIRLRDYDGTVYVVPFSEVGTTSNLTKEYSYYVFNVRVAYRENLDKVIEVLKDLAQEMIDDPEYGPKILPPFDVAGVNSLDESAVVVTCRMKTLPIQQWTIGREYNRRMKNRFDELGIQIPFPHHTVYFGIDRQGEAPPAHIAVNDQVRVIAEAARIRAEERAASGGGQGAAPQS